MVDSNHWKCLCKRGETLTFLIIILTRHIKQRKKKLMNPVGIHQLNYCDVNFLTCWLKIIL